MLNNMTDPSGSTIAWTTLAHLLRPQGRKGEILAELLTDFPERFEQQPRVFLAKPDADAPTTPPREIKVSHHWLPVGRNHGRIVLAFEGVDSINLAEELSGYLLQIPAEERVELEDDAEYISDLIGCVVYDRAEKVGAVTGIDFPATADGSRRLPDAAPSADGPHRHRRRGADPVCAGVSSRARARTQAHRHGFTRRPHST